MTPQNVCLTEYYYVLYVLCKLPPCSLSLLKHCKRANYQCKIWKRNMEASPQVPSPVGSGWCMEGEDLTIDWGEGLPAPQAVMQLLSWHSKKECVQDSCTCIQNYLKCTNLCNLSSCANQPPEDDGDTTDLHKFPCRSYCRNLRCRTLSNACLRSMKLLII